MSYLDDSYTAGRSSRWMSRNNSRLKGVSGAYRGAVRDRDLLRGALADAEDDNRGLTGRVDKLRTRNAVIAWDLEKSTKRCADLSQDRDLLGAQNGRINRKLLLLEGEADDARSLLGKVKVQYSLKLRDAEDNIGGLEGRLADAAASRRLLRREKEDLELLEADLRRQKRDQADLLAAQQAELDDNSLSIRDLRKSLGVKSIAVETLSEDLKRQGEENRVLRGKNLELQDARDADAAEIRLLMKKVTCLEDEKVVLKDDIRSLRGKLYDLSANDKRLRGLIQEYEDELDVMEISGFGGKKSASRGGKKADDFDWGKKTPGSRTRGGGRW